MNINNLLDEYTRWLRQEIKVNKTGEYYTITTPYLDRFNDYLQIYVKQNEDGSIILTDDGYIIGNLKSSGISLRESSLRKDKLNRIVKNFSMNLAGDDIVVTATAKDFPQKKHMMVQAMMYIDDMFSLEKGNVENIFIEDVQSVFDKNDIFYTNDIILTGKTGNFHKYDFGFQRTKKNPTRFCKAINHINQSTRDLTIFSWLDTEEIRSDESKLIVVINDKKGYKNEDLSAFKNYNITPVLFSKLENELSLFH